ncbi:hypothetical protein WEH80_08175 [Actinomycetes bacterium KLBMP 9759]
MTVLERVRTPAARAVCVLVVAVVAGGVAGLALAELLGVAEVRWGKSQLGDTAVAVGSLGVGALAARLLLPRDDPPWMVRVQPGRIAGWPGARLGATALVVAPLLLLAGEAVRMGHRYFYPYQLAGMVDDRATVLGSYGLYTAGLVVLVPAFLALTGLIAREQPGWAFWGATAAVVGSAVRIFQEGVAHLALHLVDVQGLEVATRAVAETYGAGYVLSPLTFVDNIAWSVLAVGAYRARVLGWLPALGVAFMIAHYTGVLKGSDLAALAGSAALAAAFVPLGVALWRSAPPVPRRSWRSGLAVVAVLVALYGYNLLTGFSGGS